MNLWRTLTLKWLRPDGKINDPCSVAYCMSDKYYWHSSSCKDFSAHSLNTWMTPSLSRGIKMVVLTGKETVTYLLPRSINFLVSLWFSFLNSTRNNIASYASHALCTTHQFILILKQQTCIHILTFSLISKDFWDKGVRQRFSIKGPSGHFKHIGSGMLPWLQSGWIPVMDQSSADSSTDWQAGWTLISPSMFDRAECKNNTNPSGPYGKFWEDQLLRAFKAIIFISHPQWDILISDEGPVVWWQREENEQQTLTTYKKHLDFCIHAIRISQMLYCV